MKKGTSTKEEIDTTQVFLFIPNLIGYTRIFLAGVSLFYMGRNHLTSMIFYLISGVLDALDGFAARYFDQCSKFGSVLDMVTDRCATTCLLCYLAHIYPQYSILFQFLISLDISSHYMHMYSSLISGESSHKVIDETQNFLLRAYYHNRIVLFLVCSGNEFFFVALYLRIVDQNFPMFWNFLSFAMFPVFAFKNILNVIQFIGASQALARIDIEEKKKKD